MLNKIIDICDNLPDLAKAIIFVSLVAIFWDLII